MGNRPRASISPSMGPTPPTFLLSYAEPYEYHLQPAFITCGPDTYRPNHQPSSPAIILSDVEPTNSQHYITNRPDIAYTPSLLTRLSYVELTISQLLSPVAPILSATVTHSLFSPTVLSHMRSISSQQQLLYRFCINNANVVLNQRESRKHQLPSKLITWHPRSASLYRQGQQQSQRL